MSIIASGCSTSAHVYPGSKKPENEVARIVAVSYPTLAIMGVDNKMLRGTSLDVRYEDVFILPGKHVIHMRWSGGNAISNKWANGTVEIDAVAGETYRVMFEKKERTVTYRIE
jgi:hypothetical protein